MARRPRARAFPAAGIASAHGTTHVSLERSTGSGVQHPRIRALGLADLGAGELRISPGRRQGSGSPPELSHRPHAAGPRRSHVCRAPQHRRDAGPRRLRHPPALRVGAGDLPPAVRRRGPVLPCIDCGRPATIRSRCHACHARHQRPYNDPGYRRERAAMLGAPCQYPTGPGEVCGAPAQQAHHVIPVARGHGRGPRLPMCAAHNRLLSDSGTLIAG